MKLIMENWRDYAAEEALLTEGWSAENVLKDMTQMLASAGAIAVTGGAGGDVVVDSIFAAKEAEAVLEDVTAMISEVVLLESIITTAAKLDYGADPGAFYQQVKGLVKKSASSGTIGGNVKEFIEEARESAQKIINKIIRAISKWVSTLIPDDFGLGGPAFEMALTRVIQSGAEDAYNLASRGVAALGKAGKLLTDPQALQAFFMSMAQSVLEFLQKIENIALNPGERASAAGSFLGKAQYTGEKAMDFFAKPPMQVLALMGVDFDTPLEDFLDMLDKSHPKDPTRIVFQKGVAPAISTLKTAMAEWIPKAVAVMRKLISLLFASIAVFQIVMNPEERKEILKIKPGSTDLTDPLGTDEMDLQPTLEPEDVQAMAESISTDRMKLIMENWRQFK